jgi:hypothetical protein
MSDRPVYHFACVRRLVDNTRHLCLPYYHYRYFVVSLVMFFERVLSCYIHDHGLRLMYDIAWGLFLYAFLDVPFPRRIRATT